MVSSILKDLSPSRSYVASFGNYSHLPLYDFMNSGFEHLYGFSTDLSITNSAMYHRIKFSVADPSDTHLPSFMFDLIFINVEDYSHRSNEQRATLLKELIRILRNDSILAFVEEDLPHSGIPQEAFLNLQNIEVADETVTLEYAAHNVTSVVDFDGKNRILKVKPFKVRKSAQARKIGKVFIIVPTLGSNEGQSEYGKALVRRFNEVGIEAEALNRLPETFGPDDAIILEYEPHLGLQHFRNKKLAVDIHYVPSDPGVFESYSGNHFLLKQNILSASQNPLGKLELISIYAEIFLGNPIGTLPFFVTGLKNRIKSHGRTNMVKDHKTTKLHDVKYTIAPHIDWKYSCQNITDERAKRDGEKFRIGTFGFAVPTKRIEMICRLSQKLKIPALLLLSVSNANQEQRMITETYARSLKRKYESDTIEIQIGFFEPCDIIKRLSKCTHLVFTQAPIGQTSGSMRLASLTNLPVISIDSPQARDSQVYRVHSIDDITMDYLEKHREPVNIDDGFVYLLNFLMYDYSL